MQWNGDLLTCVFSQLCRFHNAEEVAQDDEEVRNVLSDQQVVSLLTDPNMQRILEESRNDPAKFSQYLKDPDIRAKLMTLQRAGLIRIER